MDRENKVLHREPKVVKALTGPKVVQVILVPMVPPELMGLMENPVFLELVPKDPWENQENRETKESQETQVALDLMVLTS